jgi:hypothetical protein
MYSWIIVLPCWQRKFLFSLYNVVFWAHFSESKLKLMLARLHDSSSYPLLLEFLSSLVKPNPLLQKNIYTYHKLMNFFYLHLQKWNQRKVFVI